MLSVVIFLMFHTTAGNRGDRSLFAYFSQRIRSTLIWFVMPEIGSV